MTCAVRPTPSSISPTCRTSSAAPRACPASCTRPRLLATPMRMSTLSNDQTAEPPRDCPLCPRLVAYRAENRAAHPDWFNGPAPSFGDPEARLLIVGLAPGRQGANRTGRPFTGDFAGVLLYETLLRLGFATGRYDARPDDGLRLVDCMITNAVRCAPPGNKPETGQETNCPSFHAAQLTALPRLRVIRTLGDVSR